MTFRESNLWAVPQLPFTNPMGDRWTLEGTALLLSFQGPRRVLSTGPLNGGIREDLKAVANVNLQADACEVELSESSYEAELRVRLERLGLCAKSISALGTAAWMERYGYQLVQDEDLWLEVLATGSIDRNAVCAGDPAAYRETKAGRYEILQHPPAPGTLNLFVSTNAALDPGALARALITVTEAKTAVLRALYLPSTQSMQLATGSGTDGVIFVSKKDGKQLTDTGTHSKLGELMARASQVAIRRALINNAAKATPFFHDALTLLQRFGISELSFYEQYHKFGGKASSKIFLQALTRLRHDSRTIVLTKLFCDLLDSFQAGLLEWGEVLREAMNLLAQAFSLEALTAASYQPTQPITMEGLLLWYQSVLASLLDQRFTDAS